ncbi:hypothetical protein F441_21688 [Phytophthora nicotianae CJ01A1]|uniref:Uncharacterized protein n=5 Tax=Phytophthora nicotianae TaxID=4792 RepID=V9DY05_PHYNI|nr:hypothetical protein F443_21807 [Phytophthora nicotianae P1569]ETL27055.1 hypothetical protein L916_19360 [Phytophthora nicotianae]ETO59905.1 hypothetical protein F444_21829 [Phytophthora nicotianae P1976]ETP01004.1 hypothetical protein F441_21688 [Phytophthora nicotianae CJ01A1]ETP29146.1 hypothetical protein F442_21667 [Phytophthora nicotianae P10297]
MPRSSSRQKLLRHVRGVLAKRQSSALIRELLSDDDSDEADLDEFWELEHERIQAKRYTAREANYRKRKKRWRKMLHNRAHTSDTAFLKYFRVKRSDFLI